MELKEDYKKTEIGLIPNDWNVFNFADLVKYTKGYPFKSSSYVKCGIRVVRVSDTTYDLIKDDNAVFVSADNNRILKKWELYEHDLIVSTVGSKPPMYDSLVGKVILVPRKNKGSLLNQNAVVVRSKDFSEYSQKLLLNHFRTERYIKYIEIIFRGNANQASITLKDLFKYKIPVPPTKTEQTAIAKALSDADAWIQSLTRLITKKRQIKQGAMQTLLNPYENGCLKTGWILKNLGDIFQYQNGTSLEKYFNSYGGFEVISIGNYSSSGKFVRTNSYISHDFKKEVGKFILQKNELTMILNDKTAVGTIIGRVLLIDKDNHYVFNQRTMRLSCKPDILPLFAYYLINSDLIHEKIVLTAKPGTQIYVNTDDVLTLELAFPLVQEQISIATNLLDMDKEITVLEHKLIKAKQIKQGMMQNLLTGRIRLI